MKKLSKIFGICIILSLFLLLSACGGGGGGESVGTAISTGGNHTCGLLSSGAVKCWGHNGYGQLGDGTTVVNSNVPVDVMDGSTPLANVSAISAGFHHTCALLSSGAVKCWGVNEEGELGNGTTVDSNVPVDVLDGSTPLANVSAISAGFWHTCALTSSGRVKCWGFNSDGQLGNGTNDDSNVPVDVMDGSTLLANVSAISGGGYHTCALTSSGGVKCWGYNEYGELGDGTYDDSYVPVDVMDGSTPLANVSAISAGFEHTCAVLSSGAVKCWGVNEKGQLGNGTNDDSNVPVDVMDGSTPLANVSAISAGDWHTCALTSSGGVKCWGYNSDGQLGDGTNNESNVPVYVVISAGGPPLSGISAISAGGIADNGVTCALTNSGGAKCWGYNESGQLGDGTNNNSNVPVDVLNFP